MSLDRSHDLSETSFGETLKLLRKHRGTTQQHLALKLGIHRNTLGAWERGDYLPDSRGIVLELARQLYLNDEETRLLLEASLLETRVRWNVPYQRNPFFTGYAELLAQLAEALASTKKAASPRAYALSGLGGIGKTQTATEFAYRHAQEYSAVLWLGAETRESIFASFVSIGAQLGLCQQQGTSQESFVETVLQWFQTHRDWLLIVDNVDDIGSIKPYLPVAQRGSLLLTTRLQTLGELAHCLKMRPMTLEEGTRFLYRRARVSFSSAFPMADEAHNIGTVEKIVEFMGGLPLALDQAGSYLEETHCSPQDYLSLVQDYTLALLDERAEHAHHPLSVVQTFMFSFRRLQQMHPAATELLSACAFLAPEHIPEKLFRENTAFATLPALAPVIAHPLKWNTVLKTLQAFSLLHRNGQTQSLSLHRLVQIILKESLPPEIQREWAARTIQAVNLVFPTSRTYWEDTEQWPWHESLLPHAFVCARLSQTWDIATEEVASLLEKIATYLFNRGRYAEAEQHLRRAIGIKAQLYGPEHRSLTRLLLELASVCRERGNYDEAESLHQRALVLYETEEAELEHSHYNNLALVYAERGQYARARPLMRKALQLGEKAFGPDHPEITNILSNLASLHAIEGKYAEAQELFQRSLTIQERTLGANHPKLAFPLTNLGHTYKEQGKYREAEPQYLRALQIREETLGTEHPQVAFPLDGLAEVFFLQGRVAEAETLALRSLQIREQALGADHPQIAFPLQQLAEISSLEGNYSEAEARFQRTLRIREASLGSDSPDVATTLVGLAKLYATQGRQPEAAALFQRALQIQEQVFGANHHTTLATCEAYQSMQWVRK